MHAPVSSLCRPCRSSSTNCNIGCCYCQCCGYIVAAADVAGQWCIPCIGGGVGSFAAAALLLFLLLLLPKRLLPRELNTLPRRPPTRSTLNALRTLCMPLLLLLLVVELLVVVLLVVLLILLLDRNPLMLLPCRGATGSCAAAATAAPAPMLCLLLQLFGCCCREPEHRILLVLLLVFTAVLAEESAGLLKLCRETEGDSFERQLDGVVVAAAAAVAAARAATPTAVAVASRVPTEPSWSSARLGGIRHGPM